MIEALKNEIASHGDRAAVVPVQHLQEIRQDLEDLKAQGGLNNFQQFILKDLYDLNLPDTGFEIRSILVVATPGPASIQLIFKREGKQIDALFPASYLGKDRVPDRIDGYLKAFLAPLGHHAHYASQLPRKRLAVRSGLAAYGRNNICYVEGMGSFLNLTPFFLDIECPPDQDTWLEVHSMDLCRTCQACLRSCPTAAILPDRFLIDNERCLTYFNEIDSKWSFPGWIDPAAHHTIYGCLRCQMACPVDQPFLAAKPETLEFSEEETALLWEAKPFESFTEGLQQKVQYLDMDEYLVALPRNLRALFNQRSS